MSDANDDALIAVQILMCRYADRLGMTPEEVAEESFTIFEAMDRGRVVKNKFFNTYCLAVVDKAMGLIREEIGEDHE